MVFRSLKREFQVVEDLLSPRGRERTYNKVFKLSALREDSGACLSIHRFWAETVKSSEPSWAGALGGGSSFGGGSNFRAVRNYARDGRSLTAVLAGERG